jgi:hypothetical protein
VTVVEFLDRILPGMDNEVAKQFQRMFEKQGMSFKLASKVTASSVGRRSRPAVEPAPAATPRRSRPTWCWSRSAACPTPRARPRRGRRALDERGRVETDAHYATNVPGIYAIGDVIAGPMLAHKAEDEGVAVAEIIAGQAGHVNYDAIPNVVYTYPGDRLGRQDRGGAEGSRRRRLQGRQVPVHGQRPRQGQQQTDGFVKILADAKTDRVLGVHIVGADAGNMIAEAAVRWSSALVGGHRAHLPRASDAVGGGEGSRARERVSGTRFNILSRCAGHSAVRDPGIPGTSGSREETGAMAARRYPSVSVPAAVPTIADGASRDRVRCCRVVRGFHCAGASLPQRALPGTCLLAVC